MLQIFAVVAVQIACAIAQVTDTVDQMDKTFEYTDPSTGRPLTCESCPPGKYLQSYCTSTTESKCAECPPGTYTKIWNHIKKCIRCKACDFNEIQKMPCSPASDCKCECKEGYFLEASYERCIRHTACPTGRGVVTEGTPHADTQCQDCPAGFFSANTSAHLRCAAHTQCEEGQLLVVRGSRWHDNVCLTCAQFKTHGHLKGILRHFFAHQKISSKHLGRLTRRLRASRGTGARPNRDQTLSSSSPDQLLTRWYENASVRQIQQLPAKLRKVGENHAAQKLEHMLSNINSQMSQFCSDTAERDSSTQHMVTAADE